MGKAVSYGCNSNFLRLVDLLSTLQRSAQKGRKTASLYLFECKHSVPTLNVVFSEQRLWAYIAIRGEQEALI